MQDDCSNRISHITPRFKQYLGGNRDCTWRERSCDSRGGRPNARGISAMGRASVSHAPPTGNLPRQEVLRKPLPPTPHRLFSEGRGANFLPSQLDSEPGDRNASTPLPWAEAFEGICGQPFPGLCLPSEAAGWRQAQLSLALSAADSNPPGLRPAIARLKEAAESPREKPAEGSAERCSPQRRGAALTSGSALPGAAAASALARKAAKRGQATSARHGSRSCDIRMSASERKLSSGPSAASTGA